MPGRILTVLLASLAALALLAGACRGSSAPTPTPTPAPTQPPATPTPPPIPIPTPPPEFPKELRIIWETYQILRNEYVDKEKLDPERLSQAAVEGMLKALDDPHTSYVNPDVYKVESSDLSGQFEGIGATVHLRGGKLILSPLPNSPAERAGIRAGDIVLKVDGQSTEGWSLLDAVTRIRGPRGTPVTLTVRHLGDPEPVDITVVRDVIQLESVFFNMMRNGIAYFRITTFYENTDEAFAQKLKQALEQGAKGVILDLRDNPGGYLTSTVNIASQFLRGGVVLYEVDGRGNRRAWQVRPGGLAPDIPLVVLVNRWSASGSEVLSGALQDRGRAKLVGERTFGKGSVNLLRPLSDGGGLYFTYARWYTPSGRLIEGNGLAPDVEVRAIPGEQGDTQLERAVQVLEGLIAARQG